MRSSAVSFPTYGQYTTARLLEAFEAGPLRMQTAIEGLAETELRSRVRGANRWSIHEIVLHTADSELQGTYRIRKVWSESPTELPGYDQDRWAAELDYAEEPAQAREQALTLLGALRACTVPLFREATGEHWERWGRHPEYGPLTLRNLLELYADHTERHIDQILDCRARLNRGLDMPALLPERLY